VSTYRDAVRLAEERIKTLKSVHVDEDQVLAGIRRKREQMDSAPENWRRTLL
jgi:hypothetical protein